ncbi:thermosome subunit [Candidatus Woesearchaeota archaeon]|jgi:archaeal chaperonin|nr:thermosome subunit [Candidatus Woesearchaeota archaeon]
MTDNKQPVYILPEDAQRTLGKDAQRNNIMAAKIVAETVRTTLGPKGMDKMLVDPYNNVTITNDGVTILDEIAVEHPTAKMIVEVAKTQENEVGDGTTTAVVIAGELLKNAEKLLDEKIHPTVITKGYRLAAEQANKILNNIAEDIKINDQELLKYIAETAMTGKGVESAKDKISDICLKAITQITTDITDKDNIKIEKQVGEGIENSELVQGIVIDKERTHSEMPTKLENVKIALIDTPLEIKDTEIDAKIQISDPNQLQSFLDKEELMLKEITNKVIDSGANVVICQKGIDDMAQYFLAKKGIFALRRIRESDMRKIAKATSGKVVSNLKELSQEDLGFAGLVEEKKIGNENMTFITKCENPKAVTILIRGGTEHVVDEVERAITDALGDVTAALNDGKVVAGAGSPEMEVSKQLKDYAHTLSGREQLAVLAFAEALEIIPKTLAENAGLDPIDMLTEMKVRHDNNEKWAGIDVYNGKIVNSWDARVLEPLKVKTQAIKSASEVAELILRIDDIIASSSNEPGMPQGGMPPMM